MSLDATNKLAYQLLGCSLLQIERSWWAVRLDGDRCVSEAQYVTDLQRGTRLLDWTLDLVSGNDMDKISELWLFCPPSQVSPLGNTARLKIDEPYSAFQFKLAFADSTGDRRSLAHIIGKVDDKLTGACTYSVYDASIPALFEPIKTSVYDFHTWRTGLPSTLGALSQEVLGLRC